MEIEGKLGAEAAGHLVSAGHRYYVTKTVHLTQVVIGANLQKTSWKRDSF